MWLIIEAQTATLEQGAVGHNVVKPCEIQIILIILKEKNIRIPENT